MTNQEKQLIQACKNNDTMTALMIANSMPSESLEAIIEGTSVVHRSDKYADLDEDTISTLSTVCMMQSMPLF